MRMKATWTFGRTTGAATAVVLAAFVLVGCSAESNAQTITVDIGEGVTLDMVWIAPGRFTMGQNHNMTCQICRSRRNAGLGLPTASTWAYTR